LRLTRRDIFCHSSLAFACATGERAFAQAKEPGEYVEVNTSYGRVRGSLNNGLATFKGIAYAGSVSGANRFKAAPLLKPWTGVRDVLTLGAPAIQPGQRRNEPPPAEDCLFLNI
jgi:para-nitrobenzyl esterase